MPQQLIEFLTKPDLVDAFPKPYPASRAIPEWFRQMPVETNPVSEVGTVKRCPPFLEAITLGYIIPLPADVKVTLTDQGFAVDVSGYDQPLVDFHPQTQFPGAPFPPRSLLKFRNPWIVKTPPGYSTLFTAPMNRFDAPFLPLSGVVETDHYGMHVDFPAIWLQPPGMQVALPKGMPLVQAIPFRRDAWDSTHAGWDPDHVQSTVNAVKRNPHLYKEAHWRKKKYA